MRLKVLLPTDVLVDEEVHKVSAEARDGSFTLLPRHIDYVTVLVPGLFSYSREDDSQVYLAMAEGVLVKRADRVFVSTRNAIRGEDLDTLWQTVRQEFEELDDREREARSVIAALESTLVRELAALRTQQP